MTVVYEGSSGNGNGHTRYDYDNIANTSYSGTQPNTSYDYHETLNDGDAPSVSQGTLGTPTSESYTESSSYDGYASHSSWSRTKNYNYQHTDDTGTQDANGQIHNGTLAGVHHQSYQASSWEGQNDGWPTSGSSGDTFTHEWWELSGDAQAAIDWVAEKWEENQAAILDTVQTGLTVASIFAPPGVGLVLSLANLGISAARGQPVSAMDVALALVPGVGGLAKMAAVGAKVLGGTAKTIAAIERTGVALNGLAQGAAGLVSGAQGLADSYQQFKQGNITGGLVSAGGALLSLRGGYSGLKSAKALTGRYAPCQQRKIYPWTKDQSTCFTARMSLTLADGRRKPIAEFRVGDRLLTKNEHDPYAPLTEGVVVAVFTRVAPIWNVHVGGRIIETTREHPFWVRGKGWRCAVELVAGDELLRSDGSWIPCDGGADSGRVESVYNLEVAGDHTYFVSGADWDFDVWAHNANGKYQLDPNKSVRKQLYPTRVRKAKQRELEAAAMHDGQIQCQNPGCKSGIGGKPKVLQPGEGTPEHIPPLVDTHNEIGFNTDQPTRNNLYNDTAKKLFCEQCQKVQGGETKTTYTRELGEFFSTTRQLLGG